MRSALLLLVLSTAWISYGLADQRPPPPRSAPPLTPPEKKRRLVVRSTCAVGACSVGAMVASRTRAKTKLMPIASAITFLVAALTLIEPLLSALLPNLFQPSTQSSSSSSFKQQPLQRDPSERDTWWTGTNPSADYMKQESGTNRSGSSSSSKTKSNPNKVVRDNIFRRPDIAVPDVEPQKEKVPRKKLSSILFWRRKKTQPVEESNPPVPAWTDLHQKQKGYVEDYGN